MASARSASPICSSSQALACASAKLCDAVGKLKSRVRLRAGSKLTSCHAAINAMAVVSRSAIRICVGTEEAARASARRAARPVRLFALRCFGNPAGQFFQVDFAGQQVDQAARVFQAVPIARADRRRRAASSCLPRLPPQSPRGWRAAAYRWQALYETAPARSLHRNCQRRPAGPCPALRGERPRRRRRCRRRCFQSRHCRLRFRQCRAGHSERPDSQAAAKCAAIAACPACAPLRISLPPLTISRPVVPRPRPASPQAMRPSQSKPIIRRMMRSMRSRSAAIAAAISASSCGSARSQSGDPTMSSPSLRSVKCGVAAASATCNCAIICGPRRLPASSIGPVSAPAPISRLRW